MTTESRVYAHRLTQARTASIINYKPNFATLLLTVIVLLTGLAVIYVADLNRREFISLQNRESQAYQLRLDWGKLLLEQSTWSAQARIQSIAQERLGMTAPVNSEIVMIK